MLKKYESPELDVIKLEDRDVIVASGVSGGISGPGGIESGDGKTSGSNHYSVMPYRTRAC